MKGLLAIGDENEEPAIARLQSKFASNHAVGSHIRQRLQVAVFLFHHTWRLWTGHFRLKHRLNGQPVALLSVRSAVAVAAGYPFELAFGKHQRDTRALDRRLAV